jgi:tetratricopeptide (TPR) repeat protein
MRRWSQRQRIGFWSALGLGLLGSLALRFWVKSRLDREPNAEASAAYSRGDWERTAHLARRRLKQAPDDPKALRLAFRSAARQDRDQRAIAIYSRLAAADLEPEDLFLIGQALSRTGQPESAVKALETARTANPDHPETLDLLCRLYYQETRYYAAEEAAERLARHPDREARAQLMLGTARAELHDPAGVVMALRRWLQLDPEGRLALPDPLRTYQLILARALLTLRQPAEARQTLQDVLDSRTDPEVAWLLSRTYLQERDWGRAEAAGKAALPYREGHPLEFEPAPFVGEARCGKCHRPEYEAVLGSRHATTFTPGRDLSYLTLPEAPLPDPGNPQVAHRFHREGDRIHAEARTGDRVFGAVIDYAFGSRDHFTTFTGTDNHKRAFMMRISSYESAHGSAWDLSAGLPRRPTDEEAYLGPIMVERDGVRRCLSCHTTSFRAVLDKAGPEAADHSIGCEKCHGPGGHHEMSVEAGFSDPAIAGTSESSAAQINHICGRCHDFPRWESLAVSRTDPALYRFQSLTLGWSRCFTESEGTLSCVTCHDPHRNVQTSTAFNEGKCLSCHTDATGPKSPSREPKLTGASAIRPDVAPGKSPPKRSQTACPVNPAKGCLECHMPRTWQQETHSFKTDHFIRVRDQSAPDK